MAYVTFTPIVDNTPADAASVNNPIQQIVDGLTDGTKDVNIGTATVSNLVVNSTLQAANMTVTSTMVVSGVLEGSRSVHTWIQEVDGNTSGYFHGSISSTPVASEAGAIVMNRAGSVLGYSMARCVFAAANDQTVTPQVRKNGTALISGATFTVTNAVTGPKTGIYSTYSRGTYTFAVGDRISPYVVVSGTAGSAAMLSYFNMAIEVVYNT